MIAEWSELHIGSLQDWMMILSFFSYFSLENEPEGVLYGSICIKQTNKKLINNEKRKTGPALTVFHRTHNDNAFSISVLKINCLHKNFWKNWNPYSLKSGSSLFSVVNCCGIKIITSYSLKRWVDLNENECCTLITQQFDFLYIWEESLSLCYMH